MEELFGDGGNSSPPSFLTAPAPAPVSDFREPRNTEEPAGLADFLESRIPKGAQFEAVLYRKNEAGKEETVYHYRNKWPDESEVGSRFGGGEYRLVVAVKNSTKAKPPRWEWPFSLASYPWDQIAADNRRREREQNDHARAVAPPALDGGIRDRLTELRELQALTAPQRSPMFPPELVAALVPVAVAAVGKLLDRLLTPPPTPNPSDLIRDHLNMTQSMLSLHREAREVMQPTPEPQEPARSSWVADLVGLMNDFAPVIQTALSMPAAMRAPMLRAAEGAPEVHAARAGSAADRQAIAEAAAESYGWDKVPELFASLRIPLDGVQIPQE